MEEIRSASSKFLLNGYGSWYNPFSNSCTQYRMILSMSTQMNWAIDFTLRKIYLGLQPERPLFLAEFLSRRSSRNSWKQELLSSWPASQPLRWLEWWQNGGDRSEEKGLALMTKSGSYSAWVSEASGEKKCCICLWKIFCIIFLCLGVYVPMCTKFSCLLLCFCPLSYQCGWCRTYLWYHADKARWISITVALLRTDQIWSHKQRSVLASYGRCIVPKKGRKFCFGIDQLSVDTWKNMLDGCFPHIFYCTTHCR